MAMLLDLRTYLEQHRSASLADLSNHFRVAPDALRGMLQHWIRKGLVERRDTELPCADGCAGACGSCGAAAAFEIYRWSAAGR